MLEVIKAGGFVNGGLNFDARARRGSFELADIFYSYIAGIDAFALGFKKAMAIIADGRVDEFVKERYSSWSKGIGMDIISGNVGLVDMEKYALEMGEVTTNASGRQEYLENIVNAILFSGDL
jgi:xylose isomerase